MSKSDLPDLLGDDYFDELRGVVRRFRTDQADTQALIDGVAATLSGDAILDVLGYA